MSNMDFYRLKDIKLAQQVITAVEKMDVPNISLLEAKNMSLVENDVGVCYAVVKNGYVYVAHIDYKSCIRYISKVECAKLSL